LARPAAAWPRRNLWLGLAASALALGLTVWNMDLAARADLAIARQEAGAVLLSITPPPVADSENAARVYADAFKELGAPVEDSLRDAAYRGLDAKDPVDWTAPRIAALVKDREPALALLRRAAAMPGCSFDHQRTFLDAGSPTPPAVLKLRQGVTLLAIDARVQAAAGNLARAFEDVTAILGASRHLSEVGFFTGPEDAAWRTLEEVLRLAPAGTGPLPPLTVPDLQPLVRKVREEHALLGMILPVAASQPSLVLDQIRRQDGPWAAAAMEALVIPSRVFLIPDEVTALRKWIGDYQSSPRSPRDETPSDWADLKRSVATDPTGIYGAIYIKPKHQLLLAEGSMLAALRQTARTGLAVAAYHRKHGKAPERLEQLVPEFLSAVPTDPRDGQPLRLQRVSDGIVVYAPRDRAAVEGGTLRDPEGRRPAPIFRLSTSTPRDVP
jgi:hypothetical protein